MPQYIYEPGRPNRQAEFAKIIAAALQMREQNRMQEEQARAQQEAEYVKNLSGSVKDYSEYSALSPEQQEMLKARGILRFDRPEDRFQRKVAEDSLNTFDTLPQSARQQGTYQTAYGAAMPSESVKLSNAQDVYGNAGNWAPTIQNRQLVDDKLALSALETTNQGNVDREYTGIKVPESRAKIAADNALAADRYASAGKTKKETEFVGKEKTHTSAPITVNGANFAPEVIAAGEDVMRGGDITRVPWADRMKVFEYVAARGGRAISKGVQDKLRGQQAAEVAVNNIEKAMQDYTSTPKTDMVTLARNAIKLRSALMQSVPLIARGIGHTGVLTQQDFDSIVQGILGAKGALTGLGLTHALPEDAMQRIGALRSQFGEVQNAMLSDLIPSDGGAPTPPAEEKTITRDELKKMAEAKGITPTEMMKTAQAKGYRLVP